MPIDASRIDEVEVAPGKAGGVKRTSFSALTTQKIPEGGIPNVVGGRDAAAVSMIGHLKSGGMDYDIAVPFLMWWNRTYCQPPLDEHELRQKMSRLWATFKEGKPDEDEADPNAPPFELLDMAGIWEAAAKSAAKGWLVQDMIPMGGLVYLTAPAGVGKTWVALDLMRCALTGSRWLGRYEVPKVPVLYIDEEVGAGWVKRRMERMGFPMDAPIRYTDRAGVRLDSAKHRRYLIDRINAEGIRLVVVDSLSRVHDMKEDSNDEMRRLYTFMSEIMATGAALLVIHHDRKGGQGDSFVRHDRARGAGDISAQADMVFSVEKSEGLLKLVCTKARHVAEDRVPGCHFEIVDSDEGDRVTVCALNHTQASSRALDSTEESVVEYLRAVGSATANRMQEQTGKNKGMLLTALESLVRNGEVLYEEGPRGSKTYYLKPKDQPEGMF